MAVAGETCVYGKRFDLIARALGAGATRRGALGLLAAAAGLAFTEADARNTKQKRRKRRQRRRKQDKGAGSQQAPRQGSSGQAKSVCASAGSRECDPAQIGNGKNLEGCNFPEVGLVGADLRGVNANQANFSDGHMLGVNLGGAALVETCFAGATLRNASLRGAAVNGADFSGAELCGADLRGTNISQAQLESASVCCSTLVANNESAAPCPDGHTCCGSGCVNVQHNSANCGACGNVCGQGEVCCNGACVVPGEGGRCSGDGTCLTPADDLQQAIDAAVVGGVIHLCSGTWELTDTLLIDKDVSLYGPPSGGPAVLSGQGNNQVVGIATGFTVTLEHIAITQGDADEGAGIFNQGNLGLYLSEVTQNTARLGGGIYNEGTLSLYYTRVADNAVTKSSDPLDPEYDGGGIYNDEGTVDILTSSRIADNTANVQNQEFGMGGGVFNYYGSVTLNDSGAIHDNHAATHGGGIYNRAGQVTLGRGTTVSDNVAGVRGGGLYQEFSIQSPVTIATPTIVTGNTPDNCAGGQVQNCIG